MGSGRAWDEILDGVEIWQGWDRELAGMGKGSYRDGVGIWQEWDRELAGMGERSGTDGLGNMTGMG